MIEEKQKCESQMGPFSTATTLALVLPVASCGNANTRIKWRHRKTQCYSHTNVGTCPSPHILGVQPEPEAAMQPTLHEKEVGS